MAKSPVTTLPPCGRTESPGDWPSVILVNAAEDRAHGDLRSWLIRFRAWFADRPPEFVQWVFDGFGAADGVRVRKALRIRAGRELMLRIELFDVCPPPGIEVIRAIERFNAEMDIEKQKAKGEQSEN